MWWFSAETETSFAIGGNHFHSRGASQYVDITVVCVNNLNYGMTGGQVAATTPLGSKTTTTPAGNPDGPFNLPLMAYASGATYVSRWTILHTRDMTESIKDALLNRGFAFVEVLSPCPVNFGRRNKETALDSLRLYQENTIIKNDAHPSELGIDFDRGVILGKFVDIERPTCIDRYDATCRPSGNSLRKKRPPDMTTKTQTHKTAGDSVYRIRRPGHCPGGTDPGQSGGDRRPQGEHPGAGLRARGPGRRLQRPGDHCRRAPSIIPYVRTSRHSGLHEPGRFR